MAARIQHQLLLVLVAALVFFVNLGHARLWDEDEPKNAECAREMFERGDWITPTFNQELRYDKPALVYWLMISAYQAFGVSEFAARFWSALLAVGTTLLTYRLGRDLFGPRVGFWAGWILATSLLFVIAGRAATPDSALILCTTLAMLLFVRATWGAAPTLAGADALGDYLPKTWQSFAAMYAALAAGVLAKGPVAVVLPGAVLMCYLLLVRQAIASPATANWLVRSCRVVSPAAWVQGLWKLRPFTALMMVAVVALPWYAAVGVRTDGDWLTGFFGRHNVGRFLSPMEGHRGPIVYYLPAVLFGFFPWSILLPAAVWRLRRRLKTDPAWAAYLFLTCWAGVWIGFFSISGTKLPSYVLPAYPALAVLTAVWLDTWIARPQLVSRWLPRAGLAIFAVCGAGICVGLLVFVRRALPGDAWVACVGAPLMVGGVFGYRWTFRRPQRAVAALGLGSLAFIIVTFGFAAAAVSRHQNSAPLVSLARRLQSGPLRLATFDYSPPSLVFYARNRVEPFYAAGEVARYLAESPQAMVVCTAGDYERLEPALPKGVEVVARQRRFLRTGEVLLIGRPSALARRPSEGR
ncbi:MAG TPA: glycosyltransferase family 39 protein [Pirellulales bacterium]